MSVFHSLESGLDEHRRAIKVCLENSLILPAVVFIYSHRFPSFLARLTEQISTSPDFETWVRDYLLDGYDGLAGTPREAYYQRHMGEGRIPVQSANTSEPEIFFHRGAGELIVFKH